MKKILYASAIPVSVYNYPVVYIFSAEIKERLKFIRSAVNRGYKPVCNGIVKIYDIHKTIWFPT